LEIGKAKPAKITLMEKMEQEAKADEDARQEIVNAVKDERSPVLTREDTWKGKKTKKGVVIFPSPSSPGKFQLTYWDKDGFAGHGNYNSKEDAIDAALMEGFRTPDQQAFKDASKTDEWDQGNEDAAENQKWNIKQDKKRESREAQNKLKPAHTKGVQGKKGTTFLNDNTPIEFEYEVIDMSDVIPSNNVDGSINPDYDQDLQPRDRTR
jgi:hypothetical protein